MNGTVMEEKRYLVYVLINNTRREVFFGMAHRLQDLADRLPEELSLWRVGVEDIVSPVVLEESLSPAQAREVLAEVQEKALKAPQGRTILLNHQQKGERS